MKNKRKNNYGFTLIELLAVITIMGILMMVAIPSVTRTIENSRRDSFADIAQSYINTVRNSVLGDELICDVKGDSSFSSNVSATPANTYYIKLKSGCTTDYVCNQTSDLMESGGNSSWGGAPVEGYVVWERKAKTVITKDADGNETTVAAASGDIQTTYKVSLVDTGKHGIKTLEPDQKFSRTQVSVSGADAAEAPPTGSIECKLK